MTFNVQKQEPKKHDLIPAGNHVGYLYSIIDIGHQETEFEGRKDWTPKVRFTFELSNETKEFDGISKPKVIGREFSITLGKKSSLRPIVEGLLGVTLTDQEAYNQEFRTLFTNLLGTPCLINVTHSTKGDKTYANISAITPLPKGMKTPEQFNENFIFEIDEKDNTEKYSLIPEFIQKKIALSREANEEPMDEETKSQLQSLRNNHVYNKEEINPEDIPF